MARVLIVDDEAGIRRTLAMFLGNAGHEVETAGSVLEASALLGDREFDVVLSDIIMPGEDGLHLLELVRGRSPLTQFVLITGEPTLETATNALRLGAYDYLAKPVRKETVCRIVAKAGQERALRLQVEQLHEENLRHREELELLVTERTSELQNALHRLTTTLESTTMALSMVLEKRDSYTAGHQRRVTDLALTLWDRLAAPREARDGLRIAGLLHDLGKIQVPAEILSKPARLSPAEFALIREHAASGWEVLRQVEFPWPVATIVRQHHERLDGSGYPDGLKSGEILLEAQVLGVADVVEAMSSHRPYRPALGIEVALAEVLRGRGTLYGPAIVDTCIKVFREEGYLLPL